MADIRLVSVARSFKGLSHQTAALEWLQEKISPEVLAEFAELYRADPPQTEPSPTPTADWLKPCMELVKQFEGCELMAYSCPAGVLTIGWGHTGPDVKPGLTWTQQQADDALAADLREAYQGMTAALPMAALMAANRQAALTSWVYNVGAGAAMDSTLRRRLGAGEDAALVVAEELPKWNKGSSGVLPGLVRRRAAEVELFVGKKKAVTNPLAVPYFWQQDNGAEGWRQCQTSSIAMCLAFLKVPNIKDDVDYLAVVKRYGDTTVQDVHRLALKALGVRARFRQNMTEGELLGELKAGLPVAIGILHHGPVSRPSGGGHYVVAIGTSGDSDAFIVHDPFGELNLVDGGWTSKTATAGKAVKYSRRNLLPRWLPDGPSSGWGWVFS